MTTTRARYKSLLGTKSAKIVTLAKTPPDAIAALTDRDYDLVMLDHDLSNEHYAAALSGGKSDDATTGCAVADWLVASGTRFRATKIIVHSVNVPAAQRIVSLLSDAGFAAQHVPFGWLLI